MKLSEKLQLVKAGASWKEIKELEAAEAGEEKKKDKDEDVDPEDAIEADESDEESKDTGDQEPDDSEDDAEDQTDYKTLFEKAQRELKEAQARNRSISKQIEKQKQTASEYLDKAFAEIFDD